MRADANMRWLVDARNNLEKKGDLRKKSFITADIIASYLDSGPSETVEARLFEGTDKLMTRIPRPILERHVLINGVLRVRRSWVHDTLPDFEITEVLAELYGKLSQIVARAHLQAGLSQPRFSDDVEHGKWLDGRLPCMVGHDGPRTLLSNLKDHSSLATRSKTVKFDKQAAKKVEKRYGSLPFSKADPLSPSETAARFFELARIVFLKDKYHQTMAIINSKNRAHVVSMLARDRQEKYINSRHLALEVQKSGANEIVFIGEAWTAEAQNYNPFEFPAYMPQRREVIFFTYANCNAEIIHLSALIKSKMFGRVELGDTETVKSGFPYFLAPVFEVWGLSVPNNDLGEGTEVAP